jgi:enoyl-CoA hydratase/carnithine racemase
MPGITTPYEGSGAPPWRDDAAVDFTLTSEQRLIVETVRGFVEKELYPHEDDVERLDEISAGLAGAICSAAPLAVAAVLEILRETEGADVRTGYSLLRSGNLTAYRRMLDSRDAREGALAFAERRTPRWTGE